MTASDVTDVATRALKEGHGELHSAIFSPISWTFDLGYPNPKYLTQAECEAIVANILPEAEQAAWKARGAN